MDSDKQNNPSKYPIPIAVVVAVAVVDAVVVDDDEEEENTSQLYYCPEMTIFVVAVVESRQTVLLYLFQSGPYNHLPGNKDEANQLSQ